jgi:GDP-L-fucose synthase
MHSKTKILICGLHRIVNIGIKKYLKAKGFIDIVDLNDTAIDLTSQEQVRNCFKKHKAEAVIFSGSLSGGIAANMKYPAEFIYKNLISEVNILESARKADVKKVIFFASSCVYPKNSPQPLQEKFLLTAALEETSEPYAVAKIAGIKMCEAYNKQYGTNFIPIIPATIYGPHDSFDKENAHVISALIKNFYQAKQKKQPAVEIWGTGKPVREFIYIDDLADACLLLLRNYKNSEIINVGTAEGVSIKELAYLVKNTVGFTGKIIFDRAKPDGVAKKVLDVSKMNSLGWQPGISLAEGIKLTYQWYEKYGKKNG